MGPVQAIEMPGLEKFTPQFAMLPPPESVPPSNLGNPFAQGLQPPQMNPSPLPSPRPGMQQNVHPKARALYDFAAQESNELSFTSGQELFITEDIGGGWLRAKNQFGQEGLIPGNYVQML